MKWIISLNLVSIHMMDKRRTDILANLHGEILQFPQINSVLTAGTSRK